MRSIIYVRKKLIAFGLVISCLCLCGELYGQTIYGVNVFGLSGETPVCPNQFQTYFLNHIRRQEITIFAGCNNPSESYVYSITGGVFRHPVTNAEVTTFTVAVAITPQVKWTSNGSLTLVSRVHYTCGSTPVTQVLETNTYPVSVRTPSSIGGAITYDPIPGDFLCSGAPSSVTLNLPSTGYNYDVDWTYFVTGPNVTSTFVPIGSSNNVGPGKVSINYTVPDYTELDPAYQKISFFATVKYDACNSVSTSLWSGSKDVLPGAPTVTVTPQVAICEALGSVTISGTSGYPQVLIKVFTADTLDTVGDVVVNVNTSTRGFSRTIGNIPVRSSGGPISWRVQVANYDVNNPNQATCAESVPQTFIFPTETRTITFASHPTPGNEICYDPAVHTGSITTSPNTAGMSLPFTYELFDGSTTTTYTSSLPTFTIPALKGDVEYRLRIKDFRKCKTSPEDIYVRVEEPDPIAFSLENVVPVSCRSATQGPVSDGQIIVSATGGTGSNFNFRRGDSGAFTNATGVFTNVPSGAHNIWVNNNGCIESLPNNPVNVATPGEEVSFQNLTVINPACFDSLGTFGLEGVGGSAPYNYHLNDVDFDQTNLFRVEGNRDHTIRVTDAKGCNTSITRSFVSPSAITIDLPQVSPQSCPGIVDGSIAVTASGGTGVRSYSIDSLVYLNEGVPTVFNALGSETYTIYVKDERGCVKTRSQFVPMKPEITGHISVDEAISCFNASDGTLSVAPGGGTPGYTYLWSNGVTGNINPNLGQGDYSVTITDTKGCSKSFNHTFNQPAPLTLAHTIDDYNGFNVSCNGGSNGLIDITVSGGTTPYQYAWSNGSTAQDQSGIAAGNYSVEVTDNHGCKVTSSTLQLTQPPVLNLILDSKSDVRCKDGADGLISVSSVGGTSVHEYSLDNIAWQALPQFTGLTATSYTVRVRDNNGCLRTIPVLLTEPEQLQLAVLDQEDTFCGQANGSATVGASGGIAAYNYSWYDQALALVANGPSAQDLAAGSYTVEVSDANSCLENMNVFIGTSNGPVINVTSVLPPKCHDSNDGELSISYSQGQAPYNLSWLVNGSPSSHTTPTLQNLPGATYTARVADADGCIDFETISLTAPQPINITEQLVSPSCVGFSDGSIELTATGGNGGYVYEWSEGSPGPVLTALPAGHYEVSVQDMNNCSLIHEVVLIDPPPVVVDLGEDRAICVGQQITLAPGLAGTYVWSGDNGFSSTTEEVILTSAGTYHLSFTNVNGCMGEDEIVITTSNDLLRADFLMVSEAHAGDTVVVIDISWPAPESISWEFPEGVTDLGTDGPFAEVVFDDPGTYAVAMNAYLGECIDQFVKTINILEERGYSGGRTKGRNDVIARVEVSPNPNTGTFRLEVNLAEEASIYAAVMTLDGSRVLYTIKDSGSNYYEWDVRTPEISAGVYYLMLRSQNDVKVIRLIRL